MPHVKCPLCCRNQAIKEGCFENYNFETDLFIMKFRGLGKTKGFKLDKDECLTLEQTKNNSEYSHLIKEIKEQCQKILKILKD